MSNHIDINDDLVYITSNQAFVTFMFTVRKQRLFLLIILCPKLLIVKMIMMWKLFFQARPLLVPQTYSLREHSHGRLDNSRKKSLEFSQYELYDILCMVDSETKKPNFQSPDIKQMLKVYSDCLLQEEKMKSSLQEATDLVNSILPSTLFEG